jgi:hypothetical protein
MYPEILNIRDVRDVGFELEAIIPSALPSNAPSRGIPSYNATVPRDKLREA